MIYQKQVATVYTPDVLVCGLGPAGLTAAVAAARMGLRVMGVEKCGFSGGNITNGNVTSCCGIADMRNGEIIVGGITAELLDRTGVITLPLQNNRLFQPVPEELLDTAVNMIPLYWDSEKYKREADRLLKESGVEVLYHTRIFDVQSEQGEIGAVMLANKDGLSAVKAQFYIDCTGDGDVAAWSGAPWVMDEHAQPGSLIYIVGGLEYTDYQALKTRCVQVMEQALQDGRLDIYAGPWPSFVFPNHPELLNMNNTRVALNSTVAASLSEAEMIGRDQAWRMFEVYRQEMPEFRNAFLISSGPNFGVRESRRIVGEYTLTLADVEQSHSFEDSIAKGAWHIDIHQNVSGVNGQLLLKPYDIPYRTLVPQNSQNLLVAGRCHSADHRALGSSRMSMTAMVMGEAAGVAAALCRKSDSVPAAVDIRELRTVLLRGGAIL